MGTVGKPYEPWLLQVMSHHNEHEPRLPCRKPRLSKPDLSESLSLYIEILTSILPASARRKEQLHMKELS